MSSEFENFLALTDYNTEIYHVTNGISKTLFIEKNVNNQPRLSGTAILWLENEGEYRWFDPFGSLEFIVLTGTLNIATDNEPQPFVIFVSNGSGSDNDETVS